MIDLRTALLCYLALAMLPFALASASAAQIAPLEGADPMWNVEDSVSTRYFVSDWNSPGLWQSGDGVRVSPDGQHFALATHRGDLTCDCNRYELSIFAVASVRRVLAGAGGTAAAPLHVIRMNSTSPLVFGKGGAIRDVVWQDEGTLLFYGTGEMGKSAGVYRFELKTGALQRLTDAVHDVRSYQVHGDLVLYSVATFEPRARDATTGLPMEFGRYPLQPLRGGGYRGGLMALLRNVGYEVQRYGVFSASNGGEAHVIRPITRTELLSSVLPLSLSPDGQWAVVSIPIEPGPVLPARWAEYAGLEAPYRLLPNRTLPRLQQLMLVNLAEDRMTPLWEAPLGPTINPGRVAQVLWSADSTRVVLVNVALPLTDDLTPGERAQRRQNGYVVDYEARTGRWSVLEPMRRAAGAERGGELVVRAQWLREGRELLVSHVTAAGQPAPGTAYTLATKGRGWRGREVPASTVVPKQPVPVLAGGLKVSIRESANDPPVAVASDGKREVILVGPDPGLAGRWRAKLEDVQWSERGGHIEHGGLFLPKAGAAGGPYPLVIQVNDYRPERFWPDGSGSTAYAAQALVSQGMAVLQMSSELGPGYLPSFKDEKGQALKPESAAWPTGLGVTERVDAAVGMLAQRGLVDPRKVGLVGFSFTGDMVYYVVTHPKTISPAAAIVADSGFRGYGDYVIQQATQSDGVTPDVISASIEQWYGGSFWDPEARPRWLEHAPAFNVNRVETPMLFVYNRVLGYDLSAETMGAFRLNRREMDLLLIPDGDHQLQRPQQRKASLDATVEWMTFWLQDREIAPEKKEQYYYWGQLRKQRDARWAAAGHPGVPRPKADMKGAAAASPSGSTVSHSLAK